MHLTVLPLAVTMVAGPAILAAVIFVTSRDAVKLSLAFLLGVTVATVVGVALMKGLASLLGDDIGKPSDRGSAGIIIQLALVALLVGLAVKNYVKRDSVELPKWLEALMEANTAKALGAGLLVILLGPSDLIVMLTVGTNLEQNDASLVDALPFLGATVLLAALPLLGYLLFRRRAEELLPKVRDWADSHAWVVNVAVNAIFIGLILS